MYLISTNTFLEIWDIHFNYSSAVFCWKAGFYFQSCSSISLFGEFHFFSPHKFSSNTECCFM